jgi:capsule polysaccharide export protein KpsC/LpsZ
MTFLGVIKSHMDCLNFKYNYHKLKLDSVDMGAKFVYFPLQMQPEMTTSTLGGIYSDQLLAIENISTLIPDNWFIYVKENPKQLEGHRGEYFFRRLKLLPKVKYLSKEIDSFDLVEHSQFVANVTGTVGWEALLAGKAVVAFGRTWYQEFCGVLKYHKDLSLETILNQKIDKRQFEIDYNKYVKKTANGIVDRGYITNFPEYSDKNNALYLRDSLKKIIESLF